MTKIHTVNIIEYGNDSILGVTSFAESVEGNAAAKQLFREKAEENGFSLEETLIGLDDGYVEQGLYQLFIVRSI